MSPSSNPQLPLALELPLPLPLPMRALKFSAIRDAELDLGITATPS